MLTMLEPHSCYLEEQSWIGELLTLSSLLIYPMARLIELSEAFNRPKDLESLEAFNLS